MYVEKNFKLSEFACKCGCGVERSHVENITKLAKQLQVLRDIVQLPVTINSGCRCPAHNARVSDASRSLHLGGFAADIRITGISPAVLFLGMRFLMEAGVIIPGGLKKYNTFVHYDIRGSVTYF